MSDSQTLLLLSDTHGYIDSSWKQYIESADEVWHVGDIGDISILDQIRKWNPRCKAVFGNIDNRIIRADTKEFFVYSYGIHKFLVIHIAGRLGTYTKQLRELIQKFQPTALVCGHSHILKVQSDTRFNLLYLNPGAAGHHGFHSRRTMLRLRLQLNTIESLEVIELGKRGRN